MKLELACAVIGEGQVFLVAMNGHQRVYELKQQIQREIADLAPANTRAITLYLARNKESGVWLADNSETEALLKEMALPGTCFDQMRSSFQLKNQAFGFQSAADDSLIHVVVELDGCRALQMKHVSGQAPSRLRVENLEESARFSERGLSKVVHNAADDADVAPAQMTWWEAVVLVVGILRKYPAKCWDAVTRLAGKGLEEVLRTLHRGYMATSSASQG